MNPQETLPTPEKRITPQSSEATGPTNENDAARAIEQKSQSNADGSQTLSASVAIDAQSQAQGIQSDQPGGTDVGDDNPVDVPEIAEDVDLIEKEWVKKAKDIVHATLGDPYTQNKQITKMKLEYIKKRYDREIKTRND
jgi:hypothetical protein